MLEHEPTAVCSFEGMEPSNGVCAGRHPAVRTCAQLLALIVGDAGSLLRGSGVMPTYLSCADKLIRRAAFRVTPLRPPPSMTTLSSCSTSNLPVVHEDAAFGGALLIMETLAERPPVSWSAFDPA